MTAANKIMTAAKKNTDSSNYQTKTEVTLGPLGFGPSPPAPGPSLGLLLASLGPPGSDVRGLMCKVCGLRFEGDGFKGILGDERGLRWAVCGV